jgi:deltex-like protein
MVSDASTLKSFEMDIKENTKSKTCEICVGEYENGLKRFPKCEHEVCDSCYANIAKTSAKCPFCLKHFGIPKGNQPKNGKMTSRIMAYNLDGYPDCQTIEITYEIPNGIQDENHPNPGKRYSGVFRKAYLPNNKEGKELLKLLHKSFEYGLTFTVGRSRTLDLEDVVTWNDIHHKTQIKGSP